jgi:hypothetical protein
MTFSGSIRSILDVHLPLSVEYFIEVFLLYFFHACGTLESFRHILDFDKQFIKLVDVFGMDWILPI